MLIEPLRLPNRALWCVPMYGRQPLHTPPLHHKERFHVFCWFSPIGNEAYEKCEFWRQSLRELYPHGSPDHEQCSDRFLAYQARVQVQLACIFAVAIIRDRISNAQIVAAHAEVDAVLELMTDGFFQSWGPDFSPHARARRACALACQATVQYEATLASLTALTPPPSIWLDSNLTTPDDNTAGSTSGGWGGSANGGWGDGSWGGGWGDGIASPDDGGWGSGSWTVYPLAPPPPEEPHQPLVWATPRCGASLCPWHHVRVLPVNEIACLRVMILRHKAREAALACWRRRCTLHDSHRAVCVG